MKLFGIKIERDVHRIQIARALHSVALSFVGIYVPAFLLTHGFSLTDTILFFVVFHVTGLIAGLTICQWSMRRIGLIQTIRFSFPLQIFYFILLNLLSVFNIPWFLIAGIGGMANFIYWMPVNILLVKHADKDNLGSDLGFFFALPKIFGIVGPLLSALLIPLFGFWPMFAISGFGLSLSLLPLYGINKDNIRFEFKFLQAWRELSKRKLLFFLEILDNIIEESEWFWGIFVFLSIKSLSVPGIVGSLESLGGALFAVVVGKIANKHASKLVPIASVMLVVAWAMRFLVTDPVVAYATSFVASFLMTFFLVSYFGMIYKKIKGDREESFLILREIPTVIGRLIVFGAILLVVADPKWLFILPIITIAILLIVLFVYRKRFKMVA